MAKYRKKPVVIEAIQYNHGDTSEIITWLRIQSDGNENKLFQWTAEGLLIKTWEGNMLAQDGDWIIKGVGGEFYPCKNDIFEKTYEPA